MYRAGHTQEFAPEKLESQTQTESVTTVRRPSRWLRSGPERGGGGPGRPRAAWAAWACGHVAKGIQGERTEEGCYGAVARQLCSEGSPCQPAFDSTNCVIFYEKLLNFLEKFIEHPPFAPPPSPPTEMDGAAELGQTDGNRGAAEQQKMEMDGVSI